jgi:hypothetical protein
MAQKNEDKKKNTKAFNFILECTLLTGESVVAIVDALKDKIKFLKLDKCPNIDDNSVYFALSKAIQLQEISLMFCGQLTEKALLGKQPSEEVKEGFVEDILSQNQSLIHHLSPPVYQLKHLYLGGNMEMPEHAVMKMIQCCPRLKTCSIPAILGITDNCLIAISKHCPSLQHINVSLCSSVSSVGVIEIVKGCKMMKHLDLSGVTKLTDDALDNLADLAMSASNGGGGSGGDRAIVEDGNNLGSAIISSGKHSLKVLDISKCSLITEMCIMKLVSNCRNLTTLKMKGITTLSESFTTNVASLRPYLVVIKDA